MLYSKDVKRIRKIDTRRSKRLKRMIFLGVSLRAIEALKSYMPLRVPLAWSAAVLLLDI